MNITRRSLLKAGVANGVTGSVLGRAPQIISGASAERTGATAVQGVLPRFGDGRDWFFEKRFGLFIHWGIYSVAGWHEQHIYRKRLSRAACAPQLRHFNPDTCLDLTWQPGMQYLTFTTKHVDGFCMWDTKQTDCRRRPASDPANDKPEPEP